MYSTKMLNRCSCGLFSRVTTLVSNALFPPDVLQPLSIRHDTNGSVISNLHIGQRYIRGSLFNIHTKMGQLLRYLDRSEQICQEAPVYNFTAEF